MISAFRVTMRVQTGMNPDVFQNQAATLVQMSNEDLFFRPSPAEVARWDQISSVYSLQVSSVSRNITDSFGTIDNSVSFRPGIFDVVVPCFMPGTLIEATHGLRPAELLEVGDLVQMADHGLQPIRWI